MSAHSEMVERESSELIKRLRLGEDGLEYAAADEIEELETELQSLRAAGEWLPFKSAPTDGTPIIARYLWGGKDRYMIVTRSGRGTWWLDGNQVVQDDSKDNGRNRNFIDFRHITPPDATNTDILAEMRDENAQLIEQVSIRDNRDRDMQEIMRINNALSSQLEEAKKLLNRSSVLLEAGR